MTTVIVNDVSVVFLEAFADGWNRHDVDVLMIFMVDDCVFETTVGFEVCGKRYEGREVVLRAFVRVFALFSDVHFGDVWYFVAGHCGCFEWTFRGIGGDGKRLEVLGCDLFMFRDGKIVFKSSYFKNRFT